MFWMYRTSDVIEVLSNSGSACTSRETRIFIRQFGLKPCYAPVAGPQSNGMSEAFVKTLKCDDIHLNPLPDAETDPRSMGDWTEDHNDNHPHSGLKWRSPRE